MQGQKNPQPEAKLSAEEHLYTLMPDGHSLNKEAQREEGQDT